MRPLLRTIYLSVLLILVACGVRQTAEELWSTSEKELNVRQYHKAIKALDVKLIPSINKWNGRKYR